MTFAEKARKEHPELCDQGLGYPVNRCPFGHDFKYEKQPVQHHCNTHTCRQCWNREIPEETVEEAKPKTIKKTKASLLEELSKATEKIDELKEEVARLERYSKYEEAANETYAVYVAFKESGFEADQAFDLTRELISGVFKNLPKR